MFNKLSIGLSARFKIPAGRAADVEAYPSPTLLCESAGYSIAPHPDTRKKVVTMQLALPETDAQRELGTALYRRCVTQLRHVPRGFIKVKQFPFLPNSAYAFVVLNQLGCKSWHGRERLTHDQGERRTILNVYGTKPNEFAMT